MNPVGIVLGVLYLVMVAGMLKWLFAAQSPARLNHGTTAKQKQNCIIVPLSGSASSEQALEFACDLAGQRHAEILLTHVIEIPMTLGLDAPLETAERKGKSILAEGENLAREFDLRVETRLIRHRSTSQAVLELAQATGAETIVVGAGSPPWWSFARIERSVAELMRSAPCQVVVARAPAVA